MRDENTKPTITDAQVKHMLNRFLTWRLPENFNPDGGIIFRKIRNANTDYEARNEPVGTNLLDATQAEAMIRYLIEDMPREAIAHPQAAPKEKCETCLWDECGGVEAHCGCACHRVAPQAEAPTPTPTPKCACGHSQAIHEFEDDGAVSCCMARDFTKSFTGKTPCMCPGFNPVGAAEAPKPDHNETYYQLQQAWLADESFKGSLVQWLAYKIGGGLAAAPSVDQLEKEAREWWLSRETFEMRWNNSDPAKNMSSSEQKVAILVAFYRHMAQPKEK
jgi:hypothetical protein